MLARKLGWAGYAHEMETSVRWRTHPHDGCNEEYRSTKRASAPTAAALRGQMRPRTRQERLLMHIGAAGSDFHRRCIDKPGAPGMGVVRLICAAGGLCGLGLMSAAIAGPPQNAARPLLAAAGSARSTSVADTALARRAHASPAVQLDLQLPGRSPPAINQGAATGIASTAFPSAIHHLDLGRADFGTNDRYQPRAVGLGETSFRTMGQAQILALRIRREGLPIARLLESKSALLSIGLNQRGKPGLWVTQKTH
jgi:hypothetical protein